MEIRTLEIGDMKSLSKLYYQFANKESNTEKMERKFCELQNNKSYIFLCAVENGQLIGSVRGVICESLYGECNPFLVVEDMIVDSEHRKKGIGKSLFQELEKQAVSKGCTQVILVTGETRIDAHKFYESMGFHATEYKGYKKKLI